MDDQLPIVRWVGHIRHVRCRRFIGPRRVGTKLIPRRSLTCLPF
jgi:hypothetical protein